MRSRGYYSNSLHPELIWVVQLLAALPKGLWVVSRLKQFPVLGNSPATWPCPGMKAQGWRVNTLTAGWDFWSSSPQAAPRTALPALEVRWGCGTGFGQWNGTGIRCVPSIGQNLRANVVFSMPSVSPVHRPLRAWCQVCRVRVTELLQGDQLPEKVGAQGPRCPMEWVPSEVCSDFKKSMLRISYA